MARRIVDVINDYRQLFVCVGIGGLSVIQARRHDIALVPDRAPDDLPDDAHLA